MKPNSAFAHSLYSSTSHVTVNMNCILHMSETILLLVTLVLCIKVSSTKEGAFYFFHQHHEYPRDCTEARDQCSSGNFSGAYTIKPDGYPNQFEAYCDNDISSGGWTVIQRLNDDCLTFRRNWEDYKRGFGFLSGEFWIGFEKLSYLTNQAVYELRIDIMLSNGSSFFVEYNSFRISDEWSDYALVSAEVFRSNWSCIVSTCPLNMTRDSCTCQNLCSDPIKQTDCYTECVETCVPEGCFVTEMNELITNGKSFINADCTQNCTCIKNQLSCNTDYECSTDATCAVKDEIRKCYCNEGYEGDGVTCIRNTYTDCYEALQDGHTTDGVYTLLPAGWTRPPFTVFCDMTTTGGGWTVFQRRIDGVTDFYLYWQDYKLGFGSVHQGNDFWLGNEQLHYITNQKDYVFRIDGVHSNSPYYDEYSSFRVGNESTKYQLNYNSYVGGSSGDYLDYNNGGAFSTRDQDNDGCGIHDCAKGHRGGWWYKPPSYYCVECYNSYPYTCYFQTRSNCHNICTDSNPNGDYNGGNGENIFYDDCSDELTEMKIRPFSA